MQRMIINLTIFVILMFLLQMSGETVQYIVNIIGQFIILNFAANFITSTIVKE